MVDATDGPKALVSGLKWPKTVYCFGAIDDKSRLVCHAEFYPDQKAESLLDCLCRLPGFPCALPLAGRSAR
jgi:hypothetical protein